MAYYGAPPGAYGGGQQAQYGAPPGFAPPGGMSANSPGAMPNQFQPPPNMPANINWNASTIRLGVDGPQTRDDRGGGRGGRGRDGDGRGRLGLGASRDDRDRGGRDVERDRQAVRDSMQATHPPTREEVARTIFVGGLKEGAPGDGQIEEVLRCAGKLRRWTRARDSADQLCRFGFAEYEDVESLEAANAIYSDGIEVPVMEKGEVIKNDEGEAKVMRLLVVVDEQSRDYISEWKGKRKEDDDARQFRLDGCKEDLRQCLAAIANANAFAANAMAMHGHDASGDTAMTNGDSFANQEDIVTIPVASEDELSDIPAEMRATVAAEIKRFRDRSGRKDFERMARDEGTEHARQRYRNGDPDKPVAELNSNIPLGPRGQQVPSGPKGYRGAQLPSDYANGVAFVGANGSTNGQQPAEDEAEDDSEPDEAVEERKQKIKEDAWEEKFQNAERRYQGRENSRATALARERERDAREARNQTQEKNDVMRRLAEWDDAKEERMGREDYYLDRSSWLRKRGNYRQQEEYRDASDRQEEKEELAMRRDESNAMADDFLDRTAQDLAARAAGGNAQAPAAPGLKISLGNVAAKQRTALATATTTTNNKRGGALADVEGLLEDEEDAALNSTSKRPTLKPISAADYTNVPNRGQDLTDSERAAARRDLAAEIPNNVDELFGTPLKYEFLTERVLEEEIRPYCGRLVEGFLGVREEMLVEAVLGGLRDRVGARRIVEGVEGALGEEGEVLVRKVWRMGIFWGEAGGRGLV
ncbi:hypothetical protein LTR86_008472 [Recurvomyces mirabilis]|nr:hypothetical protein LTR86_008472 [Recurvomyces mirabilis]